ncbi:probable E3 ubiquitin-protein ligase RHY1A [Amborella trichopoda]|uniref:RING-type domain-containing protein n=1 Tax=Amborella trichopoda TaxID=13333 RepID=W1NMX3_AMBTC|nr:probable E3 ubiquitin-protein ligase RHY1A [Amborella trichopoda]ERM96645.1 hypothetical protein AMTR_s00001p00272380 [Amborella trichopoda]|eukprot:XP_006829229.1 probable E3 ubiquitin-protein ligase RHY1A [Amborella trichopoda]
MTSASELFYIRRSRIGRKPELGFETSSSSSPTYSNSSSHHHSHHHNPHHRLHDHRCQGECDPFRRSHLPARHIFHGVLQRERDSPRLDPSISHSSSSSHSGLHSSGSRGNRFRFVRNDRLPGAVLQARARLLERLRGVSLTRNRHESADYYPTISDEFRFVDAGDWETETDSAEGIATVSLSEVGTGVESPTSLKPPGLSREAISKLSREVFGAKKSEEEGISLVHECCICLERLRFGDGLVCLPCGHRFHALCLDPWLRTCGDCPYCRANIIMDS